jgi:hypothetical protein
MDEIKHILDTVIVSVSFTDKDKGLLLVGKKGVGDSADVINAFEGKEAWELYQKLITKKVKKTEELK